MQQAIPESSDLQEAHNLPDMNHRPKSPRRTQTAAPATMSNHTSRARSDNRRAFGLTQPKPHKFIYRDIDGIAREIWRPGDGDGVRDNEFPDGLSFKERYRFFQSDIGAIRRGVNSPPHFVALDDKAVWDIASSNQYSLKDRGQFWPLDFKANGGVRIARLHKGRAARVDKETKDRVQIKDGHEVRYIATVKVADKNNRRYVLSGEKGGYQELNFNTLAAGSNTAAGQTIRRDDGRMTERTKAAPVAGRHDGSMTERTTAAPVATREDGSKTDYASKREADKPLNPRHDRNKVGKYLHSTPSPTWPGGVRRLNKPTVESTRGARGNEEASFENTEWSPQAGGRTVYARMEEQPERINGRVVVSGARTSYAQTPYASGANPPFFNNSGTRTPYQSAPSGAKTPCPEIPLSASMPQYDAGGASAGSEQPMWQHVKRIEEELGQVRGVLRMRDEEISRLKSQTDTSNAGPQDGGRGQQIVDLVRATKAENSKLKQEIMALRQSLGKNFE
ncbi:hypothetical protein AUEXF2481DRAFT_4362 [Aureobasidium subglaciale EXF-2481]|uniref:Uncharacterized protein n=1 Tax=Aureobasidium subglaciale (strain EXF-2481) TaxID=1043005 RepID=A0A074YEG7_AURSE|nr:uncharacterized protein AUEXF2481DRAFT_4362 [Aureobasidium subglaciale EXF-2481]KAI5211008.1 hypothetical protein E4T38_01721 [Aureobasidium subglaciale]KAI5222520.1 hypothetical protein E4T40_04938 [Aureobasidium subglaciale]KAI5233220.1 hypothetical protein E4T41_01719 [Aureobasidium subglaciale]KAI5262188.1 hypothetical protein E4T46_04650 [Aureobasidium subglaciale]KEQ96110.1 hypothetical protein AUEXF2481DRAFT_4362 [Aureobasidium subglaciale EXF-2481]